jgi:hypothetical protein
MAVEVRYANGLFLVWNDAVFETYSTQPGILEIHDRESDEVLALVAAGQWTHARIAPNRDDLPADVNGRVWA